MAAEYPTVRVQFIEDDVAQVLEEPHPLCVVRKDSGVKHVRIRQDDLPTLPNCFSRITRRIAASRGLVVRRIGPERAPWSETSTRRECRDSPGLHSRPAGCSRASSPK